MLKVAICDNDISELQSIKKIVSAYDDLELYTFSKSALLHDEILAGSQFDIYLLDVVMPTPDGIELAQQIRLHDDEAVIIYLTGHEGRALDAFSVRASQYLLKPIQPDTLLKEMEIARGVILRRNNTLFPLKTKTGITAIPFHKIAHCHLENRCIVCTLTNGAKEISVTLRISFGEAMAPLLQDARFIHTHISFVANIEQISNMQEHDFQMKDGTLIPIAQNSYAEVKERYLSYIFGEDMS